MTTKICRDCQLEFEIPVQRGRPAVRCVPCKTKEPTVLAFSRVNAAGTTETIERKLEVIDGVTYIENSEPCEGCSNTFMRPKRRGRPPKKCANCSAVDDAAKAEEVTVSDEKLEQLFQGDRFSTQGNSWGIA